MPCEGPGDGGNEWCGRAVFRGGLCFGHRRQLGRGQSLRPLKGKAPPFERVIEAGSAFLEAESDEEYRSRLDAFRRAAEGWLRAEGWTPPAGELGASAPPSAPARSLRLVEPAHAAV